MPKLNESPLNLFSLSSKPQELDNYEEMLKVPELAWDAFKDSPRQLKRHEDLWVKDPTYLSKYITRMMNTGHRVGRTAENGIANVPNLALTYAQHSIRGPFPAAEPRIAEYPPIAAKYAMTVLKNRFKLGEPRIAKSGSAKLIIEYIDSVKPGPWPEAEAQIAKDPYYALDYAKRVLKKRFPSGEAAMATDYKIAFMYAEEVLKGRFPEGEQEIAENPEMSFFYARDILKGRFPLAEKKILLDSYWTKHYVKAVWPNEIKMHDPVSFLKAKMGIKKNKPLAVIAKKKKKVNEMDLFSLHNDPRKLNNFDKSEEVPELMWDRLMARHTKVLPYALPTEDDEFMDDLEKYKHIWAKDPKTAFGYAYMTKKRFPEGEAAIATSGEYSYRYAGNIIGTRWPPGESAIAKDPEYNIYYAKTFIKGRWPEAEPYILENPIEIIEYIDNIIKGVWPEAEPIIITNPWAIVRYCRSWKREPWPEAEEVIYNSPLANVSQHYVSRVLDIPVDTDEEADRILSYRINNRDLIKESRGIREALNLFQLHSDPDQLQDKDLQEQVPELAWEKYKGNLSELVKRQDLWLKSPETAYAYAAQVCHGRWPKGESIISTSGEWSFAYAYHLLSHHPFHEGEPAIAKDSNLSVMYAKYVLNDKFPAGEDAIATSGENSLDYAYRFGRFPKGESIIATNPDWALAYARQVMHGAFPLGEPILINQEVCQKIGHYDPWTHYAKSYVQDILKINVRDSYECVKYIRMLIRQRNQGK